MSIKRARAFRKNPSAAEKLVWEFVRRRRLGVTFRRQVPIDRYYADFASPSIRVVLELDGPFHDAEYDEARTRVIEAAGWLVVRFPSKAVINGDIDV